MNREFELDNLLGLHGIETQKGSLDMLVLEAEMENRSQAEIREFCEKCIKTIAESEVIFRYLARAVDERYISNK